MNRFISSRLGADGLPDTLDDRRFATLAEARTVLDVPQLNYSAVLPMLTLDHPVKRTECLARAGSLERRLTILSGPGISIIHEQ